MMNPSESSREPLSDTSTAICRALAGDSQAWTKVVARFSPLMEELARFRSGSDAREVEGLDPEDVVHEVWSRLLPRLRKLPDRAADGSLRTALRNYLARSVLNRIIDVRRAETRRRLHQDGLSSTERMASAKSGPVSTLMHGESASELRNALEMLSDRERQVLVLNFLEGRSMESIAAELGTSTSTVRRVADRTKDWLRKQLADFAD